MSKTLETQLIESLQATIKAKDALIENLQKEIVRLSTQSSYAPPVYPYTVIGQSGSSWIVPPTIGGTYGTTTGVTYTTTHERDNL